MQQKQEQLNNNNNNNTRIRWTTTITITTTVSEQDQQQQFLLRNNDEVLIKIIGNDVATFLSLTKLTRNASNRGLRSNFNALEVFLF